ncbi:MAG: ATP synthase F1 subunit delta [Bacteroidales bacterium]|jgi:F-type H+-transporting ATPase subunit delta|nr:ATP synthase F1 subunit delta [Bacteroidales bacterium]
MNTSIISTRYAKALILTGIEQNCIEPLNDDITLLRRTLKENPMFGQILSNPVIKPVQKHKVMDELLTQKVHPITLSFLHVLIRKKRDFLLDDIARRFTELYEVHKGIKHAHITSSTEMDTQANDNLQKKLNELYHADVQLTSDVNAALIGGFILRVDDRRYDASLASGLKRMKNELIKNEK